MHALTLIRHFKTDPLSWGRRALRLADATRWPYIEALRAADHHDFAPLLVFARLKG